MAKGGGNSEDWACGEQCAYCFTIFIGILFFLAGGAMAVYAALVLFGSGLSFDATLDVIPEALGTDSILWAIFIIGLCIAGTALLGMIMAGCAKCAANPDGKNDCCEKCCTAILSILYIIILSVLLAAALVIAGFLSYYATTIGDGTNADSGCPYPADSTLRFQENINGTNNQPDILACPIDSAMWAAFYGSQAEVDAAEDSWLAAQDLSFTCGYYCDGNTCTPSMSAYVKQTTGTYCRSVVPDGTIIPDNTVVTGDNKVEANSVSNQAYRPTLFATLNNLIVPFLVVWWCIFVLAVLLIVAACVMCVRKKETKKESTYKPDGQQ